MKRLSTQEMEAIRKRAEQATEGPWFNEDGHVATKPGISGGYPSNTASVCETNDGEYIENYNKADAEFIANAREDIPKLLAEVERLQADLKKAESIALWLARRLPKVYKTYAYNYIDDLFGGKSERTISRQITAEQREVVVCVKKETEFSSWENFPY